MGVGVCVCVCRIHSIIFIILNIGYVYNSVASNKLDPQCCITFTITSPNFHHPFQQNSVRTKQSLLLSSRTPPSGHGSLYRTFCLRNRNSFKLQFTSGRVFLAWPAGSGAVAILFLTLGLFPAPPLPPALVLHRQCLLDEAGAHLNGLNLQRGCSPLWEQKRSLGLSLCYASGMARIFRLQ